jgi:hypothetical protein
VANWAEYLLGIGFDLDPDTPGDLDNIEDVLFEACGDQFVHPTNPPINRSPVQEMTLDGIPRTEGEMPHVWNFVLPLAAIQQLIADYFIVSSVFVEYREMTIQTFDVELGTYTVWNARVFRPLHGSDYTYEPVDQLTTDLKLRMILLEELA